MTQIAGLEIMPAETMVRDRLKMLLLGQPGSGKSTLASSIAELGKTLFVDLNGEKGVQSFMGAPWTKNVDIVRPDTVTVMDDLFWALNAGGHGYDAVVIDSVSAYQATAMRFLLGHDESAVIEIKKGRPPMKIQTWGELKTIMTDLSTFWYSLAEGQKPSPMHVIMTCQVKITKDEEGDDRLGPDLYGSSKTPVLACPDFIGYCDREKYTTDDGSDDVRHIVTIGYHDLYVTKAHIPYHLHGKIPPVLGRGAASPNLAALARVLGCV